MFSLHIITKSREGGGGGGGRCPYFQKQKIILEKKWPRQDKMGKLDLFFADEEAGYQSGGQCLVFGQYKPAMISSTACC